MCINNNDPRPCRRGFLWGGMTDSGSGRQLYRICELVKYKLKHDRMPLSLRWDLEQRLNRCWDFLSLSDGYIPGTPEARRDCLLGEHTDTVAAPYRPHLRVV